MKKAICLFLAIVFICCVIVHDKSERFSFEAMIKNLTNFQNMPTWQDLIECWQSDSYFVGNCLTLPYWVDIYTPLNPLVPLGIANQLTYRGELPLALYTDGSLAEHSEYDISYVYLYDSVGNPYYHVFEDGKVSDTNKYPVLLEVQKKYVEYDGDNPIIKFFENVKAFFLRISDFVGVLFRMVKSVFNNVQYFLPWNNTVPREVQQIV